MSNSSVKQVPIKAEILLKVERFLKLSMMVNKSIDDIFSNLVPCFDL